MAPVYGNPSNKNKCGMKTEIYSRVCGYHRPVRLWNRGKQEEFRDRKMYVVKEEAANDADTSNATS